MSIEEEYIELEVIRKPISDRAEKYSEFTIPSILPKSTFKEKDELKQNWSSLPAQGVNHLTNKVMFAMMPPNQGFSRFKVGGEILNESSDTEKKEIEQKLFQMDSNVVDFVENNNIRVPVSQAIKDSIVTGNSLLYMPTKMKKGNNKAIKVFKLNNYVIKRDGYGNVLRIISKEIISPLVLPEGIREQFLDEDGNEQSEDVFLYTKTDLNEDGTKWLLSQSVNDTEIEETKQELSLDDNPFVPLRWEAISGESYGRAMIENVFADIENLHDFVKAIRSYGAAATNFKVLVKPNGKTKKSTIETSPIGAIIDGDENDVGILQVAAMNSLTVVTEMKNDIQSSLSRMFLLNSAIQRQAERVTAEEIRFMAQELDTIFGNIFSLLSQELLLPLINRVVKILTSQNILPKLPKEIKPVIVTGLDAISRNNDIAKLNNWNVSMSNTFGQDTVSQRLDFDAVGKLYGNGYGLDTGTILKGEEKIKEENELRNQQETAQKIAPEIVKQQG